MKKISYMVATTVNSKHQSRNSFFDNIFILSSNDARVPAGKEYWVVKGKNQLFIFSKNGDKIPLDEKMVQWEPRDSVVMIIKVTTSHLDMIQPGGIYKVYNDSRQDERYVIADNNEKVLFDKNIFKWEVL